MHSPEDNCPFLRIVLQTLHGKLTKERTGPKKNIHEVSDHGRYNRKPAGVFSPKLSLIPLEKGAVSPPHAGIKKFEPIVTQNSMTIRKYLGKESNSERCVPMKCVPISTLAGSRTKSRNPSACTDCYQYACAWRIG
ncbi:hypothetical protein AVEN_177998-1 [Araneus ventricosus]|uniref:Uncharacterized protein n=1 Tax=Araneus ventricosus TaxID=182803 RepID=A0A4Y2QHD4_ARAVE|nr:hypothetical protein AVEN_177998-1 [Araneus ventricosus]